MYIQLFQNQRTTENQEKSKEGAVLSTSKVVFITKNNFSCYNAQIIQTA